MSEDKPVTSIKIYVVATLHEIIIVQLMRIYKHGRTRNGINLLNSSSFDYHIRVRS